ncbi:Ribosome biogenesis protein erb1 [Spiromyces aspiralis]|uniref:Ribosome biogenesis protein erb1 n=1 Tax=Spiromyces aspiralis TaxID=68401 RepID=A0ACC1HSI8_9FUNG|nr:Ribosome biogenesis protein erb1 [Spiromyces aspiralis]
MGLSTVAAKKRAPTASLPKKAGTTRGPIAGTRQKALPLLKRRHNDSLRDQVDDDDDNEAIPQLSLDMPSESEGEGLASSDDDDGSGQDFDNLLKKMAEDQGVGLDSDDAYGNESDDRDDDGYIEGDSLDEESDNDDSYEELDDSEDTDEEYEGQDAVSEKTDVASDAEHGYLTKHSFNQDIEAWKKERRELSAIEPVYDSDTSTEETQNTTGNVPIEWYADYPHIGYDIDGKKVLKPLTKDELDKFLSNADDPDSFRTVRDELHQREVRLTDEEVEIIKRIQAGQFPDAEYNPYEPTVEWFTSQKMVTPLTGAPEPKSRFIPSKWEHKMVMKLVRAIRKNKLVKKPPPEKPLFYDIWADAKEDEVVERSRLPAPKMRLPDNSESYNPPREYLLSAEEEKEWLETDPDDRKRNYLPRAYPSLRQVPAYDRFIQERFQRMLDLYVAPRVEKKRVDVDMQSLIPKLPDPRDLMPFPTAQAQVYLGHEGRVRGISVDPSGLWLLSCSDDKTVRLWEVVTGRCAQIWRFDDVVQSVEWNPDKDLCMFLAAAGSSVYAVVPRGLCDEDRQTITEQLIKGGFGNTDKEAAEAKATTASWDAPATSQVDEGIQLVLRLDGAVKELTWHRRGNYFSTMHKTGSSTVVMIHQLSKHQSQVPFRKLKGIVQRTQFHTTKPWFIVVTQRYVRIYNLMQQELVKTLDPSAKWISSVDVHPQGDNIIVGTYDKKVVWFDLDLSTKPYKSIRYHSQAVRQVHYSRRFPLFASCSDDGTIQVFHGMVYQDMMQNPLIVPLKILRGHETVGPLGVLDCVFHPTQPWLFSAGADKTVRLWT